MDKHEFETLGEMFFHCLKSYENKIFQFLDDTNETTTHSDILKWTIRAAITLQKKGIQSNDIISICSHNQKYTPVPFIASQFLGAICNTFDPRLSSTDTVHLLKLIQPKILFVSEDYLGHIEECVRKADVNTEIVLFESSQKYSQVEEYLVPHNEEKTFQPTKIKNGSDTAIILFSSGTTGLPKGICLNHKSLLKRARERSIGKYIVSLRYSPLYWISAINSIILSSLMGYSNVICVQCDPEYTWTLIEKYKVNDLYLPPYLAEEFLKRRPIDIDISSLAVFITGGCAVSKQLMENLKEALPHTKIMIGYGLTETVGLVSTFKPFDPKEYNLKVKKPQSFGKLRHEIQWKVVDINTEELLGPNREGELRIKCDGYLFNGYYKMDSSSAYDSDGYFKTGDMAYYDEDECFYIVGRVKEIFKYKGWHILPSTLENVLLSYPGVQEAVVIGVPHEVDGEHPMAIIVLSNVQQNISAEEIENYFNAKVSDSEKLRAGVFIVDYIPKSPTGKINRRTLKEKFGILKIK